VRAFLLGRPLPERPYEGSRLPQDYEGSPRAWGETGPKMLELAAASEETGCFVADLWSRSLGGLFTEVLSSGFSEVRS
jgi:hypothetical protein